MNRERSRKSDLKYLAVACVFFFITAATLSAAAPVGEAGSFNTFTGCLDKHGDLDHVKLGNQPTKLCGKKEATVSWSILGPMGLQGLMGPAGADGKDGADGAPGAMGPAGADGKDGADGAPGAMGPAGADGKDGADGAPGAMGPAGADGKDGVDGAPGAMGPAGADGKDGLDGKDGKDGKDGLDGKDGKDGLDGAKGPKGDTGAPGISGYHIISSTQNIALNPYEYSGQTSVLNQDCPVGEKILGGGASSPDNPWFGILNDYPSTNSRWTAVIVNHYSSSLGGRIVVYAICAKVT